MLCFGCVREYMCKGKQKCAIASCTLSLNVYLCRKKVSSYHFMDNSSSLEMARFMKSLIVTPADMANAATRL